MKKILAVIFVLILFCASYANTTDKSSEKQSPNVLFIAIDDLNDWIGCMGGHPQARTPNIDKLASQGMLFTNAHCQAPICGPSRASILTGLRPTNTGIYLQIKDKDIKKANETASKATFLPDYFEQYGYETLGAGKIYHQGDNAKTFDVFNGNGGSGPKPEKRFKYNPEWFGKPKGTQTDWGAFPDSDEQMPDFQAAAFAREQLAKKHDKPFFLAVGFNRPHVPWYVPQKWFDMFPIENIQTPPYKKDDLDDVPEIGVRIANIPMMPTTEWAIENKEWKNIVQAYLACIAFVDAQVGKVMDALENSAYANNTIVVLWADHGYHIGEKNRFAKQAFWERDTRTVLMFKTPEMKGGKDCNAPVELLDIYPTLVDYCGLPENTKNDGRSILPLFNNPAKKWNHFAITSYGQGNVSMRDKRYRYILYEDNSEELYDMINDPNEWTNIAATKEADPIKKRFKKAVPKNQVPLSEVSYYTVNEYWRAKVKESHER